LIPFPTDRSYESQEPPIQSVIRLLIAAYLVEAGLVLAVAPWTLFWERNYFAVLWPLLGHVMANAYVRGAVTGIGLVTAAAGLRDLVGAIFGRRPADSHQDSPPL
jgi:hypothetical protein